MQYKTNRAINIVSILKYDKIIRPFIMTNLIFLERRGCMFQFLTLLKDAHLGQISQLDDYDYELLYQASIQHDVTALLYNQIYRFSNFPDELKQQWKRKAIQINALQTIRSDAFLRLYREFLKQDLKVLVLKGIVVRSLYLQPDNRPSNDEDLYVEREHVQKAKEIMLEQGFQILHESENVTVFVTSENAVDTIDVKKFTLTKESGFFVMSDGTQTSFYSSKDEKLISIKGLTQILEFAIDNNPEDTNELLDYNLYNLISKNTTDDCSFALMVKVEN